MKNILFLLSVTIFVFSYSACGDASEVEGCSENSECSGGYFCKFVDGICSGESTKGQCFKVPEVCTQIYMPVCGCDNRTYSSSCSAESQSISIMTEGECAALR